MTAEGPPVVCGCCNRGGLVPAKRRAWTYRHIKNLRLPDDLPLYQCPRTGRLCRTPDVVAALRERYRVVIKKTCMDALIVLSAGTPGRRLEELLGLSQGYLSKVRTGAVQPSPALCALLQLLSERATPEDELERIWDAAGSCSSLPIAATI